MFDEYAFDWITEQPCDDCGRELTLIGGDVRCSFCDIDYTLANDIVYRREVNN